jgi:hypothetical protein
MAAAYAPMEDRRPGAENAVTAPDVFMANSAASARIAVEKAYASMAR